ncbi:hypothetical protein XENOCAPTIV_029697, partial [Xenoophorus captivus]
LSLSVARGPQGPQGPVGFPGPKGPPLSPLPRGIHVFFNGMVILDHKAPLVKTVPQAFVGSLEREVYPVLR